MIMSLLKFLLFLSLEEQIKANKQQYSNDFLLHIIKMANVFELDQPPKITTAMAFQSPVRRK